MARRVLITGAAGFLGAHLARAWRAAYPIDELIAFDVLTYAGRRDRLSDVEAAGSCRFIQGDVANPAAVREAMQGCDTIVHCAAETHVDRSIVDAAPFLRTNIEGTYVLAQTAAALGVARFLHVSTDEVYGPILQGATDESAPLSPRSPYAASKAAAELLLRAVAETSGLATVIARPANLFGPAQHPEKFIPLCITNGREGHPVPIYGDGQQRRSWLAAEDCAAALVLLAERGEPGQAYNIAGVHELANRALAEAIAGLAKFPTSLLTMTADRPGHDRRYAMTDAKLRALGWQSRQVFEPALARTVAWYVEHGDWWRPMQQSLRESRYHWLPRATGQRGAVGVLREAWA